MSHTESASCCHQHFCMPAMDLALQSKERHIPLVANRKLLSCTLIDVPDISDVTLIYFPDSLPNYFRVYLQIVGHDCMHILSFQSCSSLVYASGFTSQIGTDKVFVFPSHFSAIVVMWLLGHSLSFYKCSHLYHHR